MLELPRGISEHYGETIEIVPSLLERYDKSEGVIPSEADIRLLRIKNFENSPDLAGNFWSSSTLFAKKEGTLKVILPYETVGSETLTGVARFSLGLINLNKASDYYKVNLNMNNYWNKIEGSGVYTRNISDWFETGDDGNLTGLNSQMTEAQAKRCPLLLTKLGHPDFVDKKFARPEDEVAEIIERTFEIGENYDFKEMMGQYLPDFSLDANLGMWKVNEMVICASSVAEYSRLKRIAFDTFNVERDNAQIQDLRKGIKPRKIDKYSRN